MLEHKYFIPRKHKYFVNKNLKIYYCSQYQVITFSLNTMTALILTASRASRVLILHF
ncbi:hypothetical protein PMEGAPR236_56980 [Priestia megaterium]